jgi:dTDP-4-dehydrorhamnose reductase
MRILVTGASGQLGFELSGQLRAQAHEVLTPGRAVLDLLDPARAGAEAAALRPDWVINCAAFTEVDRAETEPAEAFTINRDSAGRLAAAMAASGGRMLQVSTDFVFDGRQSRPYRETDTPHPLGVYGQSKLAGEQAVLAALPGATILRTAWVYGVHGHNFVKTILRVAREGRPLRVVADQIGAPSWTRDIAGAITALVQQGAAGIYHYANAGSTSWHGFASAILEEACATGIELETTQVTAITSAEYPTPARRPAWSVLDTARIQALLAAPIPHWRDSLRNMLKELQTCADYS